jgi:hypothetical protein
MDMSELDMQAKDRLEPTRDTSPAGTAGENADCAP